MRGGGAFLHWYGWLINSALFSFIFFTFGKVMCKMCLRNGKCVRNSSGVGNNKHPTYISQ